MDLKKTNLLEGKVKFLFMTNNRSISQNKALRESILRNGVLQPLTVIRAADVDDGISNISRCDLSGSISLRPLSSRTVSCAP